MGDTLVVRTLSGSVWGDTMTLVPELRIGELEGDEALLFGALSGLDVDEEGRIYVLDRQAANVRVFSPAGEHLLTIGRSGEGPGEFLRPDGLRVTADGSIVVRDSPWRFSVFSDTGEYLGGWLLLSGYSTSVPFFLGPDERVVNPTIPGALVRYELDGTVVDTIPVPSQGFESPVLEVALEGGRAAYSIPFMHSEAWTMTRDGRVLFGVTDRYRIDRFGEGRDVLRVERAVEPVPVLPEEGSQARDAITRSIRRFNSPSWRWQGPDIPTTKPPWTSVRAGMDGSIWVQRSTLASESEDPSWDPQRPQEGSPTRWTTPRVMDVFDADGRFLGPVLVPADVGTFPEPVLSPTRVWAASVHETGYPQVVRYRVVPLREVGGEG